MSCNTMVLTSIKGALSPFVAFRRSRRAARARAPLLMALAAVRTLLSFTMHFEFWGFGSVFWGGDRRSAAHTPPADLPARPRVHTHPRAHAQARRCTWRRSWCRSSRTTIRWTCGRWASYCTSCTSGSRPSTPTPSTPSSTTSCVPRGGARAVVCARRSGGEEGRVASFFRPTSSHPASAPSLLPSPNPLPTPQQP